MNYKTSYFEQLTKEATTIEVDYQMNDRWGNPIYDEKREEYALEMLIRASKYSSKKNGNSSDYDVYINEIAQHTLSELILLPDEVVLRIIKRLQQIDKHINDAWKVLFEYWEKWNNDNFSSFDFEWKFFHLFNIPITRSTGVGEDPNFDKGKTTDSFFWDLHDAMMYKQGAVKWVLWYLKEQMGIPHEEDEQDPKDSKQPSPDNSIGKQQIKNQDVFALLCHYLKDEIDYKELASQYEMPLTDKQMQVIEYYHYPSNRTGVNGRKKHKARIKDFENLIQLLCERGDGCRTQKAKEDYSVYLENHERGDE
ncbi:hypothetical protein [Telluribacter sp.]|jgi:hypothetical protein|uniref:hypothetical protein n=1 Tax=Telluribacter sp. TaxID=1978767 RepID=UPI002E0D5130|nr:hypothetical protein [Telluribacter sp.]